MTTPHTLRTSRRLHAAQRSADSGARVSTTALRNLAHYARTETARRYQVYARIEGDLYAQILLCLPPLSAADFGDRLVRQLVEAFSDSAFAEAPSPVGIFPLPLRAGIAESGQWVAALDADARQIVLARWESINN